MKVNLPGNYYSDNILAKGEKHLIQEPAVRLRAHTYELEESNVKLKLTLCDTVGFGDQVNKEDSFGPVVDYVDNQFEAYLQGKLLREFCKYRLTNPLLSQVKVH